MSKKKPDKKILCLEGDFKDILVCKKKELRPYIEIFVETPQNITQQSLGTLAGIFEITDDSEDSSYIVNYLISIIKKEYFSKAKRGPMESFEAALHKANLALSKLAEHETVGWISHFNAVCLVLEKNNLHISQAGTASAFLLRSKTLTNICESESSESQANPIRTFEDVLSGRLEEKDKIILATETIFDIFSFEEIKRSALKFSASDFIQFLKTALINELDQAAVLIVDIREKREEAESEPKKNNSKINAFSQQAFIPRNKTRPYMDNEERTVIVEELKKELIKEKEGFVDKKTGHIYIKDDSEKNSIHGSTSVYAEKIKMAAGDLAEASSRFLKKGSASIISAIKPKKAPIKKEAVEEVEDINIIQPIPAIPDKITPKEEIIQPSEPMSLPPEPKTHKTPIKERILPIFKKTISAISITAFYAKSFLVNRIFIPTKNIIAMLAQGLKRLGKSSLEKYKGWREKRAEEKIGKPEPKETADTSYDQNPNIFSATREEKTQWFKALSGNESPVRNNAYVPESLEASKISHKYPRIGKIFPDFSKIASIFKNLDYQKKIYIVIIVVLILVVPYFFNKFQDKLKEKQAPIHEAVVEAPIPLKDDLNVTRISDINSTYADGGALAAVNVNGKIFAIKKDSIISLADSKNYSIPQEFTDPELYFEMDDLNLILLIKNNKIMSFSATSGKFVPNNINIPSGTIASAGSYLTYAYILDTKNSQIYRFPRAEGGFGEKTDWIKDKTDLSGIKSMAINDNVYVADGSQIMKFYRGKKQDFTIGQTATPIAISQVYTKADYQNLYILDKTNSRIAKLDVNGNILAQYYNSEIANASGFSVDEQNNTAYISGDFGVKSFIIK